MARSKNIRRDESGCPIVPGGETFGTVTKPMGGRRAPRSHDLKARAADRLAHLMTHMGRAAPDPMSKDDVLALIERNNFARLPDQVRFHYYVGRLEDLVQELKELETSGNKKKCEFTRPVILMEMEQAKKEIADLYLTLQQERRVVEEDVDE